ncbi:xylulokinase [Cohnella massiliensis]|uniref:xylulokinase n=1 Tax=Cohnella massiliensis TaxID=1816691 RepID=UPI0009BA4E41|nr:xylulokinase [Cohnella massiliensis]
MALILSLDLGTSSVKSLLMEEDGSVVCVVSQPYPTLSPRPGWSEQQPEEWIEAAVRAAAACMERSGRKDIGVISLSGHMSGLVLVDKSGEPLLPCIPLADSRSFEQSERLGKTHGARIRECTGNPAIDAFQAPKLLWVKERFPELYDRAARFLFPKDYLRYRLTGRFATDSTDAGNSLFFDAVKQAWDKPLAAEMGFRADLLPDVLGPAEIAGALAKPMAERLGLPEGIPVAAGAADMATGALGTGAIEPGDTALTIGTSATMLSVTGGFDDRGYGKVTFHPHALPGTMYALGSHFSGGLSLNWLASLFHDTLSYERLQELGASAAKVAPGSDGVLFLPFLAGGGSPRFDPHMRGSFAGLSVSTGRPGLFRAVLEGISYNLKETLALLEGMNPGAIGSIRVGGGGAKIGLWPGILANVFGKPVELLPQADASSMGAAMLGGVAVGMFPDLKAISRKLSQPAETVPPEPEAAAEYERHYAKYLKYCDFMGQL